MSEKTLDNVIRQLRIASEYINNAEHISKDILRNYNVAATCLDLKLQLKEAIEFLNNEYRRLHYK